MTDSDLPMSERVLHEAAIMFRELGYARTSTRELGERLGIRGASLYHHYKSKEELFFKICSRSLDRLEAEVRAAMGEHDSAEDRLRAMFTRHFLIGLDQRSMHAPKLTQLRELTPAHRQVIVQRRRDYEQLFVQELLRGQEAGVIRTDIEATYLALSLFNNINWTIQWFRPGGRMDAETIAATFFEIAFRGCATRS